MIRLISALSLLFVIGCTKQGETSQPNPSEPPVLVAKEEPAPEKKCEQSCEGDHTKTCQDMALAYDKCNANEDQANCSEFLGQFKKAVSQKVSCSDGCNDSFQWTLVNVCSQYYDSAPHPKIHERGSYLLKRLKLKEAEDLMLSDEFRKTLDGAVASNMLPEIKLRKAIRDGVDLKTIFPEVAKQVQAICDLSKDYEWTKFDSVEEMTSAFTKDVDEIKSREIVYEIVAIAENAKKGEGWKAFQKEAATYGNKNLNCPNLKHYYNKDYLKLNPNLK